ncbi:MAG: alginate lyase family protein [Bdellovibrionaceae bacterium]|nr:alginate lyase family protein [Pseudobdellovibrionaceae bacterium]
MANKNIRYSFKKIFFNLKIIIPVALISLTLQFFFINAGTLLPVDSLLSDDLPSTIPETTLMSSECFIPGEIDQHLNFIKSTANTIELPSCKERFVKPVVVIKDNISYVPGSGGSVYICRKYRQHQYYAKFLTEALNQVTRYADTQLQSADLNVRNEANTCLAHVFHEWAKVDALGTLDGEDAQVEYAQMWNTGGLATVYLKYPSIDTRAQTLLNGTESYSSVIKRWFTAMGSRIYVQVQKTKGSPFGVNNMFYWRAYSLMATALISRNNVHIQSSQSTFIKALSSVTNGGGAVSPQDKGYLPGELMRRSRSLTYHEMALEPIMGMINLSEAMGCSFLKTDQQVWSTALLIRKLIEGHHRPEVFQQASFCYLNPGCNANGPVPYAQLKQTSDGNAEHLIPLLGSSANAQLVLRRTDTYLRTLGLKRSAETLRSNSIYNIRFLGGDIRLAPRADSIPYPEKSSLPFCQ